MVNIMLDNPEMMQMSLKGLEWKAWISQLQDLTDEDGYTESLGDRHAAIFVENKPVLLVTFETHQTIQSTLPKAQPLGWQMVQALGWSHLCLVSDGETWFRDPCVIGYFDRLVDDGIFEDFDQVIFYGAGACGYAAAAFSVAAPGAKVVVVQPQATLDPQFAEWDNRFSHMRRVSFDDRYGYAPDMLDAAQSALVLYDPEITEDAMHAALFTGSNTMKYRVRFFGANLEQSLIRMNVLLRILAQASANKLTHHNLSALFRVRRKDRQYLFNLLKRVTRDNRNHLTYWLSRNVLKQHEGPQFSKALKQAEHALGLSKLGQSPDRFPLIPD